MPDETDPSSTTTRDPQPPATPAVAPETSDGFPATLPRKVVACTEADKLAYIDAIIADVATSNGYAHLTLATKDGGATIIINRQTRIDHAARTVTALGMRCVYVCQFEPVEASDGKA